MIYTIGHRLNYLKAIANTLGIIEKTGRKESCKEFPNGYCGGIVFKTIEEAIQCIDDCYNEKYAVFGLDADWEKDTYQNEEIRNLLNNVTIIVL